MKDPVLSKLLSDAGVVLRDLWRIVRHQPPVEEWQAGRRLPGQVAISVTGEEPSRSGLCYFHLN